MERTRSRTSLEAQTSPIDSANQITNSDKQYLNAMNAAMKFMQTDVHARILSEAAPVQSCTRTQDLRIRGLAEPGSQEYLAN